MIDVVDSIIAYESGELGTRETVELFSELVKSGTAWSLQGHYGRSAVALIERGVLTHDGTVNEDVLDDWIEAHE